MRRLLYYLRRRRFDRELEAEIQFHLEARVEELERSGLSSGDARAQASSRSFSAGVAKAL